MSELHAKRLVEEPDNYTYTIFVNSRKHDSKFSKFYVFFFFFSRFYHLMVNKVV